MATLSDLVERLQPCSSGRLFCTYGALNSPEGLLLRKKTIVLRRAEATTWAAKVAFSCSKLIERKSGAVVVRPRDAPWTTGTKNIWDLSASAKAWRRMRQTRSARAYGEVSPKSGVRRLDPSRAKKRNEYPQQSMDFLRRNPTLRTSSALAICPLMTGELGNAPACLLASGEPIWPKPIRSISKIRPSSRQFPALSAGITWFACAARLNKSVRGSGSCAHAATRANA